MSLRFKRGALYARLNEKRTNFYNSLQQELMNLKKDLNSNNVKLILIETPISHKLKNLNTFEKHRINHWIFNFNDISSSMNELSKIYGNDFEPDYIQAVYDGAKVIQRGHGKGLADYTSKYVNIVGGHRITIGQPNDYANTVYVFGACTARGTGVEDNSTIESYLQKKINEQSNFKCKIENYGIGCGSTIFDDIESIHRTNFFPGDVVILLNYFGNNAKKSLEQVGITLHESSSCFTRPHNWGEWFVDEPAHTTARGNLALSEYIYNVLITESAFLNERKKVDDSENDNAIQVDSVFTDDQNLKQYIEEIKQYKICNDKSAKIGSIVMNCNPFTLGHKYLIETAIQQVDFLYIFVVQENKSFFDFNDRIELVKRGTQEFNNIVVLPSGKFIISSLTFPGYFYKDNLQDAVIDSAQDIDIFGQHIAPALNISLRFAGEEPIDLVTRQYNQTMAERLPLYHIKFVEIPRKELSSEVISASRVRSALEIGDFDAIRKLVPDSTFTFLERKFKND